MLYETYVAVQRNLNVYQASKNRGSAAPRKFSKVAEKIDVGGELTSEEKFQTKEIY